MSYLWLDISYTEEAALTSNDPDFLFVFIGLHVRKRSNEIF